MRWLALFPILGLLLTSCTTIPIAPALPFGEFVDQILDPLAGKIADERVDHAKAIVQSQRISPELAAFIGSLLFPGIGTAIGAGLAAFNNSSIQEKSVQLDARRLPLKKELLALLTKRTFEDEDLYRVCVDGAERRYGVQEGKFVRLADGSGYCETVLISTK